jgi:short-subunit dehydrogenase
VTVPASSWPAARTIFLAGASSGIGRESALHLARDGHRLALSARGTARLEDLRRELAGGGADAVIVPADLRRPEEAEAAARSAAALLGPIDTLVYSAGSARFAAVAETSDALWREMLGGNLDGLFHCVRALLPGFRALGRGHVVAVLFIAARQGFAGSAAYSAAKFGALGFLESLRAETRREGIHVTAVLPGATDTPLWDGISGEWDRSRMMKPEQVARVLASALRETTTGMVEEIRVLPTDGVL